MTAAGRTGQLLQPRSSVVGKGSCANEEAGLVVTTHAWDPGEWDSPPDSLRGSLYDLHQVAASLWALAVHRESVCPVLSDLVVNVLRQAFKGVQLSTGAVTW